MQFEIKMKIFYDYFNFREIIKLRLVNKDFRNIINNKKFWKNINLIDINTNNRDDILKCYSNSKESYIYCLNKNIFPNIIMSIPTSLKEKFVYTHLLII